MRSAIVTGGAGFIGGHLVSHLIKEGYLVKVLDNFSVGRVENLASCDKNRLMTVKMDLRDGNRVVKELEGFDVIFHLAADPEVRTSALTPKSHYENNVEATWNILEALRINRIKELVFTSSSVIYGEAEIMPTPEDYPPNPISIYGTTKLACEVLIKGYAENFGIRALILRPANIIGSNATHGVILDFIKKLKQNPSRLEILGDGRQSKSYLHVSDFVEAIMEAYKHFKANRLGLETYNVGNLDSANVLEIAQIVVDELGLKDVKFNLTGGVEGGRGWKGDVKMMLLSVSKLGSIGWHPSLTSTEAIRRTVSELLTPTIESS